MPIAAVASTMAFTEQPEMSDNAQLRLVESEPIFDASNQGRFVRPATIRHWNGLVFGTQSELRFAQALDRARLFYAPLAGCRVTEQDGSRRTREVDFLVVEDGVAAIVELDGVAHQGRAADDHRRDRSFKRAGIWVIERLSSVEILRDPDLAVRRIQGMIRLFRQTA